MGTVEIAYRYERNTSGARPRPTDADAALLRLIDGNRAFAELLNYVSDDSGSARRVVQVDPRDLGLSDEAAAPSQHPFAAVLGCSDARVPLELIFTEGPNDLFVIRVAGNGLGADVVGSLGYAVEHLGDLKLIVVLGHSGCGAVSAAVDIFLDPGAYLSLANRHSLREILDGLLAVVHASARKLEAVFGPEVSGLSGYRRALIETAIVTNAAMTAHSIQREIGTESALQCVYGVYLLETRAVWTPSLDEPDGTGLAPAPRDLTEFQLLGDAMAKSSRMAAMLGAESEKG